MVKAAPELNRRANGHGGTELLFARPPPKAGGASRRKPSAAPEPTIRDEHWEDETFSVRPPKITSVQEHLLVEELRIKDENAEAERELRKSAADRVINIFLDLQFGDPRCGDPRLGVRLSAHRQRHLALRRPSHQRQSHPGSHRSHHRATRNCDADDLPVPVPGIGVQVDQRTVAAAVEHRRLPQAGLGMVVCASRPAATER